MKNIYEFDNGVTEWVIADSEEEAKKILKDITCVDDDDIGRCMVVSEERLSTLWYIDSEQPEPDEEFDDYNKDDYQGGYLKVATFKQCLEEATISDYFARSEE